MNKHAGFILIVLLITLFVTFSLRWAYLPQFDFHEDEFYSLLAVEQTMAHGTPTLPSGLFYDKGLAYSYLTAFFLKLTGFNTLLARSVSVGAGMLGVAFMFRAGQRLSGEVLVGMVAMMALAFDPEAITWSTRARMYSLGQLFIPLLFLYTWHLANRPRPLVAGMLLGVLAGGLLAHAGTAVLMPGLLIAGGVALWSVNNAETLKPMLTWPVILAGFVTLGLALFLVFGGTATNLPAQIPPLNSNLPLDTNLNGEPLWETLTNYLTFLFEGQRAVLSLLAGGAIIVTAYRLGVKGDSQPLDRATLFLTLILGVTLLIMLFLPIKEFKRDRNLFLLLIPQLYLLSGVGVHWLVKGLGRFGKEPHLFMGSILLMGVILVYPSRVFWQPQAEEARYDLAYGVVKGDKQAEDVVMVARTAVCYLYLKDCDYYMREVDVRGTNKLRGNYTDWYVGAPWIGSQSQFNALLAEHPRAWFVVKDSQLSGYFTPQFIEQIVAQMDLVDDTTDILIFRSNGPPWSLPQTPEVAQEAMWENDIRLKGYHLQQLNDTQVALTLFWQNAPLYDPYKIFVQLRSPDGGTLAQADHIPWPDLPDSLRREVWGDTGIIRDRVIVDLPAEIDLSQNRFIIGFYHPETWERRPVINDKSGEYGVWLE